MATWPHVRTTFPGSAACQGLGPGTCLGYAEQPRTEAELMADGWIQISSCADNHPKYLINEYRDYQLHLNLLVFLTSFPGDRYVRSFDDKDIVIILDGNGFIAGMQSVVMQEYIMNSEYDFANNPAYVPGDWNGEAAYFTTAYFVDTAIICNGGRTEVEFQNEGTGNQLSLQVGPLNNMLLEIPTTEAEMLTKGFKHLCGGLDWL